MACKIALDRLMAGNATLLAITIHGLVPIELPLLIAITKTCSISMIEKRPVILTGVYKEGRCAHLTNWYLALGPSLAGEMG
jgi:magnesium-transporting ATPase (P-type)